MNFKIEKFKNLFHLNFLLWLIFNFIIASSLISLDSGISTGWRYNYGDISFHLRIIHTFVFGDNPIPEYPSFPGQKLSYPFMINHWSAMIWSLNPEYVFLKHIFIFQWVLLWSLCYFFVKGNRFWILPWVILLGGGSLIGDKGNFQSWFFWKTNDLTIRKFGEIDNVYVSFLYKIWVTQRSSIFGLTVFLGSLHLFFNHRSKYTVGLAGFLIASMALIHAHFALIIALFLFLYLLCELYLSDFDLSAKNYLIILLISVSSGCIYLPWLLGKSSIISFSFGWLTPVSDNYLEYGINFFIFWFKNVGHIFLLSFILFLTKKDYKWFIPLLVIFIIGNLLNISVWKWDQIKIFIPLNIILFFYISTFSSKKVFYYHFLLILLCFPALNILKLMYKNKSDISIYTKDSIKIAEMLKANTPKNAIIAGNPTHNSPVNLSGRFLYYGYEGLLWSHAIKYHKRKAVISNFESVATCRESNLLDVCPDYILFTADDKKYWNVNEAQIKKYKNVDKVNESLYKIN